MAKKDPDLLYIFYLACWHIYNIYKMVGVVILFLVLVLHQTKVAQNVALF